MKHWSSDLRRRESTVGLRIASSVVVGSVAPPFDLEGHQHGEKEKNEQKRTSAACQCSWSSRPPSFWVISRSGPKADHKWLVAPNLDLSSSKILTRVICSCPSAARPGPYQRRCPWLGCFHDCFMTLPDPPWKQKSAWANISSLLTRLHMSTF